MKYFLIICVLFSNLTGISVASPEKSKVMKLLEGRHWKLEDKSFKSLGDDTDILLIEIAGDKALINYLRFRAMEALSLFPTEKTAVFLEHTADKSFAALARRGFEALKIGFSKTDIAIYSKTLGWITTVIFTLLGGLFVIRSGVLKAMFLAGIIMATTNLLFSVLAWSGKSELLFAIAVIFDDIAAAFATVAFVAFISLLVDRAYTATQYALLASIGTAGRTTLASSSGALVDWLNGDWGTFFILTALMVIPSLFFLWFNC